jgi:hypothetical protein
VHSTVSLLNRFFSGDKVPDDIPLLNIKREAESNESIPTSPDVMYKQLWVPGLKLRFLANGHV